MLLVGEDFEPLKIESKVHLQHVECSWDADAEVALGQVEFARPLEESVASPCHRGDDRCSRFDGRVERRGNELV